MRSSNSSTSKNFESLIQSMLTELRQQPNPVEGKTTDNIRRKRLAQALLANMRAENVLRQTRP